MSEQTLSFTRERIRPLSKLIILSLLSVALMVLDGRYSGVAKLKSYTATALQPLQWLANQPVRFYEYSRDFLRTQNDLLAENKRLLEENVRLQAVAGQSAAYLLELKELRTLQQLQNYDIGRTTAAEVISNSRDPLSDKLIINKGSRDGLRAGDAVIDQHGLIGQISQIQPFSAELTLLTNGQVVIPVMVGRTGVRSLLYGTGNNINLRYFPVDADLQAGDVLVTSGLDSIYPVGIPVAKVDSVQRASGTPYYRVTLTPLSAVRSSKYVLVLPQTEQPAIADASAVDSSASAPKSP